MKVNASLGLWPVFTRSRVGSLVDTVNSGTKFIDRFKDSLSDKDAIIGGEARAGCN